MGIFGKIKDAIFGGKAKAQDAPHPQTTRPQATPRPQPTGNAFADAPVTRPTAPAAAAQQVDVEEVLGRMDGADRLNWQTSIVDLMKLLDIDSSYENRKELAGELGRHDYSGSAEDNIWLHKQTMREIAKNGGKVPASMTD